jgi:hypothetical protein
MKQGSADDPFADDAAEEPETENATGVEAESLPIETELPSSETGDATDQASSSQTRSLPYIHSRDGVKDGRTQRPIFLRDHIEEGIEELVAQMEDQFGEDVYKTDITEAAMAVAQENPHLVQAKLDEWGYGWE